MVAHNKICAQPTPIIPISGRHGEHVISGNRSFIPQAWSQPLPPPDHGIQMRTDKMQNRINNKTDTYTLIRLPYFRDPWSPADLHRFAARSHISYARQQSYKAIDTLSRGKQFENAYIKCVRYSALVVFFRCTAPEIVARRWKQSAKPTPAT